MDVAAGTGARREFAVVVILAVLGVALVSLVAFTPWYEPSGSGEAAAVAGQVREQASTLFGFLLG
jgi:hypothetical protein